MKNLINIPEYNVSQFNKTFKEVIESNFDYVRIKGEISEVKIAAKGQIYITLIFLEVTPFQALIFFY